MKMLAEVIYVSVSDCHQQLGDGWLAGWLDNLGRILKEGNFSSMSISFKYK